MSGSDPEQLATSGPPTPASSRVLGTLFLCVDGDGAAPWTPVQQRELRLMVRQRLSGSHGKAAANIGSVAVAHLGAYKDLRGNTRLLGLLER